MAILALNLSWFSYLVLLRAEITGGLFLWWSKSHYVIIIVFNWFRYSMRLLIFFFKFYYFVFYVYWYFACMYVHAPHAWLVPVGDREGVRSPGTRATDDCQLQMSEFWELNLGSLEEQLERSTTEHLFCPYDFSGWLPKSTLEELAGYFSLWFFSFCLVLGVVLVIVWGLHTC